jgi:hypothetical protein
LVLYLPQRLLLKYEQQVAKRFVVASELLPEVLEFCGPGDGVGEETGGRLPGRLVPLVTSCHD